MPAILRLSLLLTASLCAMQAAASPRVVVSIPPVHSLVAGVMEGVAAPELLIKGSVSVHGYTLRPSQLRTLGHARLLFRVGSQLEGFLDRPLAVLEGQLRVVDLLQLPGMVLLPARSSGMWRSDQQHHDTHQHSDSHLWLDPRNAEAVVSAAVAELSTLDPTHADRYRANGVRLLERLRQLDRQLAATLEPIREIPYLVFHDAYHYLEQRYDLAAVGAVVATPEHSPGARRLRLVRKQIRQGGIRCLFREPQYAPPWLRMLTEDSDIRITILDPLGNTLTPGPELYFSLMRNLAASLVKCLKSS